MLPSMNARPGTALNFTPFPATSFPKGSTTADITRYSLDTSHILRQMLLHWEKLIFFSLFMYMSIVMFTLVKIHLDH